jgi:hypothetical protein
VNTILLSFALLTPLANVLRQVFDRRERALVTIAKFRSATFLLFMGHCIYDWGTSPKGREASDVDVWVEHADEVLRELVALSDELFRFLTLPISTTSRYVMLLVCCLLLDQVASHQTNLNAPCQASSNEVWEA